MSQSTPLLSPSAPRSNGLKIAPSTLSKPQPAANNESTLNFQWSKRTGTFTGHEQYDVVLVCPNPNPGSRSKPNQRRQAIAARCRFVGLEVSIDTSRDGDERLLKLSAHDELLEEIAEHITMEKRLKVGGYTDYTRANKRLFQPASSTSFFTSLERCRLILAILEMNLSEGGCDIDINKEIADGVLSAVVPIHEASVVEEHLMERWAMAPLKVYPEQPLDDVRDYYGERIAFYFAFAQTLTRSLIAPSIVGFIAVCGIFVYGSPDNPLCPLYSMFILLWITGFCKQWRREEARLAFRWNVEDYEETERTRREFKGPLARGFYSREGYFLDVAEEDKLALAAPLTRKFTPEQRQRRQIYSIGVIGTIIFGVMAGIVGVLAYRSFLQLSFFFAREIDLGGVFAFDFDPGKEPNAIPDLFMDDKGEEHMKLPPKYAVTFGSILGGIINSIFISITNSLYAGVATRLNNWENHRTETEHDDALILKTFTFQFVNSYASLFYIAFVKASQINVISAMGIGMEAEYCHNLAAYDDSADAIKRGHGGLNPYCMGELSTMLTSLVITSQITAKLMEFILPRYKAWSRTMAEESAMRKAFKVVTPLSYYEKQSKLEPFDGVFAEYSRLVIQIGYIVLFAPAFPIASLVCYVSFLFEIRTDAFKLLMNTQRPRYAGAQDIGSWQKVLLAISVIGIFTNMGMIGYTSTSFSSALPFSLLGIEVNQENKAVFLFLCEHVLLAAQLIVYYALPDVPKDLSMARAKANWRRTATVAIAERSGNAKEERPIVVDGTNTVRVLPVEWHDDAVPERFWKERSDAYLLEPRQGREWAKLIKAGEMKEEERHQQALNESSAQRLAMAKEALAAQKLAIKQGTVPPPQPLPPPKSPTKSPPRPTTVNGSCNGSYATQLLSA